MEKFESYFNEYAVEDQDDIITICESASISIYERFKTRFDDPRLLAATFAEIYYTIADKLKSLQKDYSAFAINICDRLEFGYNNKEDEDDEKVGNYNVYIRHLSNTKKNNEVDDPTAKAVERAVQWNTENVIEQPELLRKISVDATEALKNSIDLNLAASELIWPIFIMTYESIINFLKIKRRETDQFQYEINFMSCFSIGTQETEDADEIYFRPSIEKKLNIKDDTQASSKHE